MPLRIRASAFTLAVVIIAPAHAAVWDAHGHRTIALLAMDGLSRRAGAETPLPEWLAGERAREMVSDQSTTPDRWRSGRTGQLRHLNEPDHYLDVEDLEPFGLTLSTIPPLRHEYLRAMAIAKHEHPENFVGPDIPPYNPATDPARTKEWPGFLPHAVLENYGKLQVSMRTARILERLAGAAPTEAERARIDMARANVHYHMGVLAHYVGDAAQPLHTTRHHHGWVGSNPRGFTTDRGIHAYIDGTILTIHGLDYGSLRPAAPTARRARPEDPWEDVIAYIGSSFERVVPLYELKQSGDLERAPGRAFIAERLNDAGDMLGALYAAAWASSAPRDADVAEFVKYDGRGERAASPAP